MKISGFTLLALSVVFLFNVARTAAASEGMPFSTYEDIIDQVESNKVLGIQYSSNNHTLIAQRVGDQGTNELTCIAPWLGGSVDPLFQKLLRAHHVTITIEAPRDDRWENLTMMMGWILVPVLTLIMVIVTFVRQNKIIKKLDA